MVTNNQDPTEDLLAKGEELLAKGDTEKTTSISTPSFLGRLGSAFGGGAAAILDITPGGKGGNMQAYLQNLTADENRYHDAIQQDLNRSAQLERTMLSTGASMISEAAGIASREGIADLDRASRKEISGLDRASRKDISGLDRESSELIAKRSNETRLKIAKLEKTERADREALAQKQLDNALALELRQQHGSRGMQGAALISALGPNIDPGMRKVLEDPTNPDFDKFVNLAVRQVGVLAGPNARNVLGITVELQAKLSEERRAIKRTFPNMTEEDLVALASSPGAWNEFYNDMQTALQDGYVGFNNAEGALDELFGAYDSEIGYSGAGRKEDFGAALERYDDWVELGPKLKEAGEAPILQNDLNHAGPSGNARKANISYRRLGNLLEANLTSTGTNDIKTMFSDAVGNRPEETSLNEMWTHLADNPSLWNTSWVRGTAEERLLITNIMNDIAKLDPHLYADFAQEFPKLDAFREFMHSNEFTNGDQLFDALKKAVVENTAPAQGQKGAVSGIMSNSAQDILPFVSAGRDFAAMGKQIEAKAEGWEAQANARTDKAMALDAVTRSFRLLDLSLPDTIDIDSIQMVRRNGVDVVDPRQFRGWAKEVIEDKLTSLPLGARVNHFESLHKIQGELDQELNNLVQSGRSNSIEHMVLSDAADETNNRLRKQRISADDLSADPWYNRELSGTEAAEIAGSMVDLRRAREAQAFEGQGFYDIVRAIQTINPEVADILKSEIQFHLNIGSNIFTAKKSKIIQSDKSIHEFWGEPGKAFGPGEGSKLTEAWKREKLLDWLLASRESVVDRASDWVTMRRTPARGQTRDQWEKRYSVEGRKKLGKTEQKPQQKDWLTAGLPKAQADQINKLLDLMAKERETLVGEGNTPPTNLTLAQIGMGQNIRNFDKDEEKALARKLGARANMLPTKEEIERRRNHISTKALEFQRIHAAGGNEQYTKLQANDLFNRYNEKAESLGEMLNDYPATQGVLESNIQGPTRSFYLSQGKPGEAKDLSVFTAAEFATEEALKDMYVNRLGATFNQTLDLDRMPLLSERIGNLAGSATRYSPIELYEEIERLYIDTAYAEVKRAYTNSDVNRYGLVQTAEASLETNIQILEAMADNAELMGWKYEQIIQQTPELKNILPGKGYDDADPESKAIMLLMARQEVEANYATRSR